MTNICPTSLFPKGYRASGVVLDIAELPSPYGIGDLGPGSLIWVDRLHQAGQGWWHALQWRSLPCCESVYASLSSFAGNALLISPDWLIEDGLLSPRDCECVQFPAGSIDYDVVVPFKHWLLEKAWQKFNVGARKDLAASYERFRKRQGHWLEDYGLFCALKAKYRRAHCSEWPAGLLRRGPTAIADARRELSSQIDQVRFSQFLLFRQADRLKSYAHARGVRLIGDLPFFISADSSEAWAHPELFVGDGQDRTGADADLIPICFSSNERLGPHSDRGALNRVSYRWCVDRLHALLAFVDVACVTLRPLTARWHAAGDAPAIRLPEGPGDDYLNAVSGLIGDGLALNPTDGFAFRERFQVPETRILKFAFDGSPDNPHLPRNYRPNSVVYIGMHDCVRTAEWFDGLPGHQRQALWDYLKRPAGENREVARELIRLAWSSTAALAMAPFPDLFNLEGDRPIPHGRDSDHRRWRCSEDMLSATALRWLRELTSRSNRSAELKQSLSAAAHRTPRIQDRIEAT